MPYATQQDLIDRFGEQELIEQTDRENGEEVDANVVSKALADADELIDSYIARRVALPLSAVPDRLVRVASNIARYFLYADRPTEAVQRAYDLDVKWLLEVSQGKAVLSADGVEPTAAPDLVAEFTGDARLFSRAGLKGY